MTEFQKFKTKFLFNNPEHNKGWQERRRKRQRNVNIIFAYLESDDADICSCGSCLEEDFTCWDCDEDPCICF